MFKIIAAAALIAAPIALQAEPAGRQIEVGYHDLDLSSDAGMAALHSRLDRAAKRVCAIDEIRDPASAGRAAKCRREALVRAHGEAQLAMARQQSRLAQRAAALTVRPTS